MLIHRIRLQIKGVAAHRWKRLVSGAFTGLIATAVALSVSACDPEETAKSVKAEPAKAALCAVAKSGNESARVSDDLRRSLASSIADSTDGAIYEIATKVEASETAAEIQQYFAELIVEACGTPEQ